MADITLSTESKPIDPTSGSIAATDPKIANTGNPFVSVSFDEYDIKGLQDFNQFEVTLTPDATLGAGNGAVQIVNAETGAVLAQNSLSGIAATATTAKKVTITSFPGIKYKVHVVGAATGNYTLGVTDAGLATSIVTPLTAQSDDGSTQLDVGTVGPNSELFRLASSNVTDGVRLFDIALAADKKLYGIGPDAQGQSNLFVIDPGRAESIAKGQGVEVSEQIIKVGLVNDSTGAILSNTIDALDFGAGKLYAISKIADKLYTIDPTTAVATVAGDLPVAFNSSGDLVYDAAGNRFLATSQTPAGPDELWSIPVATPADASKIGNIGNFTNVTGLSFQGSQLTGFTSGNATAVGDRIVIDIPTGNGTAQDKIGDGATPPLTNGIGGASTITAGAPVATNLAPTGITFTNPLASVAKTASTAAAIKVADLAVTDDNLGTNVFSLTGTDAASFEITGTSLFLKAGTVLNPATKPSLGVTVNVDDAAVGTTPPDAKKDFTLAVTDTTVVNPPSTTVIGTKGQSATQRTIDLTDYAAGTILKTDVTTKGDAAYTNNIGFYVVQDAIGTIKLADGKTLKPTDPGYAVEAVKSAILQAGKIDSKLDQNIAGGSIYAPVVIAQGSLADFVKTNTNDGGANAIHAYFNYLGANPDKLDHFKLNGNNTFAVEDQYGLGDKDFNDLVVTMNVKQPAAA
jgi:Domain of unknown function (DUF4114)